MALTMIGLIIGIVASYFDLLHLDQLYGVSATDPATFFEIALILSLVAFFASFDSG